MAAGIVLPIDAAAAYTIMKGSSHLVQTRVARARRLKSTIAASFALGEYLAASMTERGGGVHISRLD